LTIEAIYTYTMAIWDERQADAYDDVLNRAFRRIQSFPWIGRVASDIEVSSRTPRFGNTRSVITSSFTATILTLTP